MDLYFSVTVIKFKNKIHEIRNEKEFKMYEQAFQLRINYFLNMCLLLDYKKLLIQQSMFFQTATNIQTFKMQLLNFIFRLKHLFSSNFNPPRCNITTKIL